MNNYPIKHAMLVCCLVGLSVLFSDSLQAQFFSEISKGVAFDRQTYDKFSNSIDLNGNYAIVGAEREDHDASGGDPLTNSGSAYIYEQLSAGNWVFVQKIVASDRASFDQFGHEVAISGEYAVVSAHLEKEDPAGLNTVYDAGSVYIFKRQASGNWIEVQKIVASDRSANDAFGFSVGISGNYLIVGARYQDENPTGSDSLFDAGAAYLFERDATDTWVEVQKICASDRETRDHYGISVDISGTTALVGAWQEDEDANGLSTKLNAGSAYVYELNTSGDWEETAKLVANDRTAEDIFGKTLAIYENAIIVGASHEDEDEMGASTLEKAGAAYIFEKDIGGSWLQTAKLIASDREVGDWFGTDVDINRGYIIVGAQYNNEDAAGLNNLSNAGSAYIFERDATGMWNEIQKIASSDRDAVDLFGSTVAMGDQYALVGAQREDEDVSGANTLVDAGSVYFFEQSCPAPTNLTSVIVNPTKVAFTWLHLITTQKYQMKGNLIGGGFSGQKIVTDNLVFIGGLTSGQSYIWRVRARCLNKQVSPFSAQDTFSLPTASALKISSDKLLSLKIIGDQLKLIGQFESVDVYSLDGRLVLEESALESDFISLRGLSKGAYLVVANGFVADQNGLVRNQLISEKIIYR